MALTQVAGGMIASGQSIASPTFTGTSTFAGGVANAYGFGVGTAVPSSGAGITFPATQSASSDANTLDDYEEGTWTPTLTFGGGSTGITYTARRVGTYAKVGKLVTVYFFFATTSKGSSTGNAVITGLPFTNNGTYLIIGSGCPMFTNISNSGLTTFTVDTGANTIVIYTTTTAGSRSVISDSNWLSGTCEVAGAISYYADV